ncbi:JAB domain-containing protein [Planomicrobium okeanokoites]|uniref:JAB domain-containing protein n=1 Tax=Planomicrobium okeanokoites TaxID=244 RepID=UPI0024905FD0|nr:JAB domain-containing protein [Planomicrobium okeanokoites]
MNYIAEAREAISSYHVIGGVSIVEMQSILAVLIGPKTTPELAGKLASLGIKKLVNLTLTELQAYGLSKSQAQKVHAGCLMARSYKNTSLQEDRYTIRSPKDAAEYLMDELSGINQEHFVVAYLNIKNQVIHKETIFIGSLNASIVHPREIFRVGVKHSAASIVAYHSHPSGNPLTIV